MNWIRALLVVVVVFLTLAFLTVAAVGCAATAALGTAAAVISESGVVEAFEEVADGAERLQIEAGENYLTFTDLDSGESRTIRSGDRVGTGRVEFSLPELTITAEEGGREAVKVLGQQGQVEVQVPQITVTGPDGEQARIVVPEVGRPNVDVRVPRVDLDEDLYWTYDADHWYGPERGLQLVGDFIEGMLTLAALVVLAAIVYVVLRNRRREQEKLAQVKGDDNS